VVSDGTDRNLDIQFVQRRTGLRIVHVAQATEAGTATVVRHLVQAGVQAGHSVVVACPDHGPLPAWTGEAGATWHPLPMKRAPGAGDLRAALTCRRLAAGADVLHLHSSKAAAVGRLGAVGMRRKPMIIMTPHGWSWYAGGRAAVLYRWFERLAARWVDVVVAVSRRELADGVAALGPHAAKLILIENGVDTDAYTPEGERAGRRSDPLLVCVGRFSEQKGQDLAIAALAALPDHQVRLRLVGDGPARAQLLRLADAAGVLDRLELTGWADSRPHLRAADVVVVPSRWEGMSLLLLEAMACGAVIVATDTGGSDALGAAGIIVPLQSAPQALANEIAGLLANAGRRRCLGRAARARAVSDHQLSTMLAAYLRLWETPVAQR
jgi:glycosyltransferase involved in cell wall biosynthesis